MKLAFEVTVDEVTDAIVRRHEVTGLITRRKWQALAFFIVYFAIYWLLVVQKEPTTVNFAGAVFATVSGYGVVLVFLKKLVRMSVRRFVPKWHETADPVPAEIQLNDDGGIYRKKKQEVSFSWDGVSEVMETDTSIELILEPPSIVVIYKRIFNSPEQLQSWLTFIREHVNP